MQLHIFLLWPATHNTHTTKALDLHLCLLSYFSMTGVGGRPEVVIKGGDTPTGPWKVRLLTGTMLLTKQFLFSNIIYIHSLHELLGRPPLGDADFFLSNKACEHIIHHVYQACKLD